MARSRILKAAILSLLTPRAFAWTYTQYITTTTTDFLNSSPTIHVTPTKSVTPTSTEVITTTYNDIQGTQTWVVTLTNYYLGPGAANSVCALSDWTLPTLGLVSPMFSLCSTSSSTSSTISTRYFAPLIIENPSSCTKTSFSYTSSRRVDPILETSMLDAAMDLSPQATDSSEALFITTKVVTLSTDLGGQAVTTRYCDVYLKPGAVEGIKPDVEYQYLTECVDPSSYLCTASTSAHGCATGVPITYPPIGQGGNAGATTTRAAPVPASTNGAGSVTAMFDHWVVLCMAVVVIAVLM